MDLLIKVALPTEISTIMGITCWGPINVDSLPSSMIFASAGVFTILVILVVMIYSANISTNMRQYKKVKYVTVSLLIMSLKFNRKARTTIGIS